MHEKPRLLFITGSTKANSTNQSILKYLQQEFAGQCIVEFFDLTVLPYFNPDLDHASNLPVEVTSFRNAVSRSDGFLLCTPEYVFSLPGVLKNALEWLVSTILLTGKPTAFVIASAGGQQAFNSMETILATLQARMEPTWKLLISGAKGKVSEGIIVDAGTKHRLDRLMVDFLDAVTPKHS